MFTNIYDVDAPNYFLFFFTNFISGTITEYRENGKNKLLMQFEMTIWFITSIWACRQTTLKNSKATVIQLITTICSHKMFKFCTKIKRTFSKKKTPKKYFRLHFMHDHLLSFWVFKRNCFGIWISLEICIFF